MRVEVWAYVCLSPRYPYANWLADHPRSSRGCSGGRLTSKKDGRLFVLGCEYLEQGEQQSSVDPAAGPRLDWSITTVGAMNGCTGTGCCWHPGPKGRSEASGWPTSAMA